MWWICSEIWGPWGYLSSSYVAAAKCSGGYLNPAPTLSTLPHPTSHSSIPLYVQLIILPMLKNLLKTQQIQLVVSYVFVHWKLMIQNSCISSITLRWLPLIKEKVEVHTSGNITLCMEAGFSQIWSHNVTMLQLNLNLTFTRMWHMTLWTNFSCHLWVICKPIIKIYIYTHVTLESLVKFIGSLTSCTQDVNKFVEPFASCMRAHDMHVCLWHCYLMFASPVAITHWTYRISWSASTSITRLLSLLSHSNSLIVAHIILFNSACC